MNLLNELFSTLKNNQVNDADRLMKELQTKHIITKQNNSLKELYEFITPVSLTN
jgi:hypothetical protein